MNTSIQPFPPTTFGRLCVHYSFSDSPFARICLASTSKGLCSVSLALDSDQEAVEQLRRMFPEAELIASAQPEHERFMLVFGGKVEDLRFHLRGTPFQLAVWNALLNIPMGSTTTYGALAKMIGRPKAVRAVGSAVGKNPIFFALPCHRVLPASGGIGHYYWGSGLKQALLEWESHQSATKKSD